MSIPRFPHTCIISRTEGDVQDGEMTTTTIYHGSCRKELSKFDDKHYQNSANTAQWVISLPIVVKINYGDEITVDDGIAEIKGYISDWATTVVEHYNSGGVSQTDSDGNVKSLDGTTTKGLHVYVGITKN
jgi:hypothetical protein